MDHLVERLNISSLNPCNEFGFTPFERISGGNREGGSPLGSRSVLHCRWIGRKLLTFVLDSQVCHVAHFLPRGFFAKFSNKTGTPVRRYKKSFGGRRSVCPPGFAIAGTGSGTLS